jgi:hypothetical protein
MRKYVVGVVAVLLFVSSRADGQQPGRKTDDKVPFERIFEYTLFNEKLPDGKHPVWIYYQSRQMLVRVVMPSLDLCVVTQRSEADVGLLKSGDFDVIPTDQWGMALQIWRAAFQRDLLVHDHLQLC